MGLTTVQKWIIVAVIFFAIAVIGMVFAILSWVDSHRHPTPSKLRSGMLGLSWVDASNNSGFKMARYHMESGQRESPYLLPYRTMNQDNACQFGRGRVATEMVSIWETVNQRYIRTIDLQNLDQVPTFLKILQQTGNIAWDMQDGQYMNRSAVCWDETRNRWLLCVYSHNPTKTWELVAVDPVTGEDTLVPLTTGNGPERATVSGTAGYGGCMGMEFCAGRLFAVFARFDDSSNPGVAHIVEFNPEDGTMIGAPYQWNESIRWDGTPLVPSAGATGQPLTECTLPFVRDKSHLDAFVGMTFDDTSQRLYLLLGGEIRIIGWVHISSIPAPLAAFDINVYPHPAVDYLNDIFYVLEDVHLPDCYPKYHDMHRQPPKYNA